MKRLYLLFTLLFTGILAEAQFTNLPENLSIPEPAENSVGKMWGTYPDSSTTYDWNISKWDAKYRKVYTYDALNRVETVMEYDATSGSFEHKYTYTYNAKDQAIEILMEANFGGNLMPFNRFRTNYDGRGNRTSYKKETYVNNKWEVSEGDSIAYIYDGQNRVTDLILNQLSGNNVIPVQKLIWSNFNQDNLPQTLVVQSYSGGFNNYIRLDNISWKAGFELIDFNPTSYMGSLWQNNDWQLISYDTSDVKDGKIQTSYLFNVNGSQLDSSVKTEYLYDKTGLKMQTLSYLYQFGTWTASSGDRDSISYGSYDEIQKRTIKYYSQADKDWIPASEERFHYNSLALVEPHHVNLQVYPNPANNLIQFDVPTTDFQVALFDLQGRQVLTSKYSNQLSVVDLKNGLYMLKVYTDKETYTARIAVKH